MAVRRSKRRKAEGPPEDRSISNKGKLTEKPMKHTRDFEGDERTTPREVEVEGDEEQDGLNETDQVEELPFIEVRPLPAVKRTQNGINENWRKNAPEKVFENRAPLQSDDKVKALIREALKNPIGMTTEDLLSVSEPARQELRKLLTKKRVDTKSVVFAAAEREEALTEEVVHGQRLPDVSYEISGEDTNGVPTGALIIGDPVLQYLSTLQPGEKPKKVVVAEESQGLRAIYPLINEVGEVESLLDGGSQIVSMARKIAEDLEIAWNPNITIHMQSANGALEQTLGLAKNVPFTFGHFTVYLQVHVMENPAYKVLLGRPFDVITESLVKNEADGSQLLTLTDPDSGKRCVMGTHERGRPPTVMKKPIREDF